MQPQNGAEGARRGRVSFDWEALAARWKSLAPAARMRLAVAGASVLLAGLALAWYASRPSMRVLYAGLDPRDARELASQLTAAKIPFEVSPDGTILRVPVDSLDKARLQTAGKSKSGRMGFELFDKPSWIGSEFDEKVNYQRALEGELERTIDTLGDVQSSRVNLVMPHDSLFTDDQRAAKASVVIKLRHRGLAPGEAGSIRSLVAGAVDDLTPADVTLVDADGGEQLGRTTVADEHERYERDLTGKLITTLLPVTGDGNVRASVNVEYDSSSADEVDELYDPASVVTLAMQRSEQSTGGAPVPAGVPGTASNAPNAQPPLFPQQKTPGGSERQESDTYGASKRTRHLTQGPGKIRRITAAVLINGRAAPGGRGAWTPDQIARITGLARATVGFDASRGDVVTVESIPFEGSLTPPVPGLGARLLGQVARSGAAAKWLTVLLLALALIFFVLRPMVHAVTAAAAPALGPGAGAAAAAALEDAAMPALNPEQETQKARAQHLFDEVAGHVNREPQQTARLLQSWINAEE